MVGSRVIQVPAADDWQAVLDDGMTTEPAGDLTAGTDADAERRRLLVLVSRLYYLDGRQKTQISDALGISRFKVARCLNEARRIGMVSVTIHAGAPLNAMSAQLSKHLGLKHAQVIEVYGSEADVRATVGQATGSYLSRVLTEGDVLGIGWGRTLNAMLDGLDRLPQVEIFGLAGRFKADNSNSAAELIRRAVALTGGPAKALSAPFFIDDARRAAALRHQLDIAGFINDF